MSKMTELNKAPGIKDLPMRVRAPFIQALIAEEKGDREKAEAKLDEAIRIEEELAKS